MLPGFIKQLTLLWLITALKLHAPVCHSLNDLLSYNLLTNPCTIGAGVAKLPIRCSVGGRPQVCDTVWSHPVVSVTTAGDVLFGSMGRAELSGVGAEVVWAESGTAIPCPPSRPDTDVLKS